MSNKRHIDWMLNVPAGETYDGRPDRGRKARRTASHMDSWSEYEIEWMNADKRRRISVDDLELADDDIDQRRRRKSHKRTRRQQDWFEMSE